MSKDKLTDKQRVFCEQYVIDWNGTRAAIHAGYSEKSARGIASENLLKPLVSEYIEHIQEDIAKLAGVSALSNLLDLKKIITTDKEQTNNKLKAIEIINKMIGSNSADKIDHTSNGSTISFTIGYDKPND